MKKLRVHFMGIGGSGISSVAGMAREMGFEVSGCDLIENRSTRGLVKDGLQIALGHDASHLRKIDILAHTPAVFYQNLAHPEYAMAEKRKIAMIWEQFMATHLMKNKFVIAVSGTHGKGTTSAMLSFVLEKAGLDPTCEIGANLIDWGKKGYRVGKGKYFVCEADEFREKFLLYSPSLIVITSIEMDHPEFFPDFEAVLGAFEKFVRKLVGPKILVINEEDAGCVLLLKKIKSFKGLKIIKYSSLKKTDVKLKLPGNHIRSDAGAVWAVARHLGVKEAQIRSALSDFSGLERRFEIRGKIAGMTVIDDYAHHPTAVEANIRAVREGFPKVRIVVVFQPHMHARLEKLFEGFAKALTLADKVVVTDVYSKREPGVIKPTGKELAMATNQKQVSKTGFAKATYVGGELENVANFVLRNAQENDVVLVMGAGDVYEVSDTLLLR